MSEDSITAIIVAIITALGLIMAGGLKMMWDMRSLKTGVHETREQVQNDHSTGLRDDIDDKHDVQMAALQHLSRQLVKSDRRQWKAINKQNIKIERLVKKK